MTEPCFCVCPSGGGHSVPGHRHQPAGRRGLGDDAVLLRLPLHAGAGEAGEVRRPPAVLRHRAAHRDPQAGGELRLPAGAQRAPAPPHLGGHAALHPRGHRHGHHEQRLPGVRHVHRTAVRRERQPGDQRHHLHVLRKTLKKKRGSKSYRLSGGHFFKGGQIRCDFTASPPTPFLSLTP